MALVSIADAAKLVRKTRATLMRDIDNGRLAKTVLQDGDVRIDTAELLRIYGRLQNPEVDGVPREARKISADKTRIALLEERIRSLERVIALEAELRRVKDQVTTELRARLADKDHMIKILESKILFLEYDKQTLQSRAVPTLEPDQPAPLQPASSGEPASSAKTADPATPAAPAVATIATAPAASARRNTEDVAASATAPKMREHPGAGATASTTATDLPQAPSVTTTPRATTLQGASAPGRATPGAPGNMERRQPPAMRNWWKRLFGGGKPSGR